MWRLPMSHVSVCHEVNVFHVPMFKWVHGYVSVVNLRSAGKMYGEPVCEVVNILWDVPGSMLA